MQGGGGKADQGPLESCEVSGVKGLQEGETLGQHWKEGGRLVPALSGPVHYPLPRCRHTTWTSQGSAAPIAQQRQSNLRLAGLSGCLIHSDTAQLLRV